MVSSRVVPVPNAPPPTTLPYVSPPIYTQRVRRAGRRSVLEGASRVFECVSRSFWVLVVVQGACRSAQTELAATAKSSRSGTVSTRGACSMELLEWFRGF